MVSLSVDSQMCDGVLSIDSRMICCAIDTDSMSVQNVFFVFQAEDGIRDLVRSRGLGDVYKRQPKGSSRAFSSRASRRVSRVLTSLSRNWTTLTPPLSLMHI